MANKVDVFTEELSKVFTILQQQYVMIKYMKTLITSGELDETEISKLKEQVTLINNQIQHINEKMGIIQNDITGINSKINTINSNINNIENALARHTDEIDNNIATINALNNVMPTDINVDSNGNLILEHDGTEITGQKKQVAVYTKEQVNELISGGGGSKFFRHDLTFTEGNGEKYVGVVYSSKDLEVNTFDKLATLIGRTGNQNILVVKTTSINESTKDATNIRVYWFKDGFVWLAKNNTNTINVSLGEVSDVVTPM